MYKEYSQPAPLERIIAGLSYFTGGGVGFLWIIFAALTHNELRTFLRYHVYQSIFLSILYFLLSTFLGLLLRILSYVPFLKNLIGNITFYFTAPIVNHMSLINVLILLVMFYLIITSVLGKYSYIPWVSDIIKYNTGR